MSRCTARKTLAIITNFGRPIASALNMARMPWNRDKGKVDFGHKSSFGESMFQCQQKSRSLDKGNYRFSVLNDDVL